MEMRFQLLRDADERFVRFRHIVFQLVDMLRGADAGHDILALGIHQIFAVKFIFPGRGAAGKGHAGAAIVAHIAKDHGLHVDRRAQGGRDIVELAVIVGARRIPRTEHRLDGADQLLFRVLREGLARRLFIQALIGFDQFHQAFGAQVAVQLYALRLFGGLQGGLKRRHIQLHHHVGKHLDEPAVGIVGKPWVLRGLRHAAGRFVGQAQVEHGIHHAWHGDRSAGTHRHQQRVFRIAKALARLFLQALQGRHGLRCDLFIQRLVVFVIVVTCFCGNREPRRNGQAQAGHFGQVGAFAAQQLAHVRVSLFKGENVLFHLLCPLF